MAVNPKSLENLKKARRFQKGNKGGGRKKLPDIDGLLTKVLSEEKDGITAAEAILLRQRQLALSGDQRAAEYLMNRAYGSPQQKIDHTGEIFNQQLVVGIVQVDAPTYTSEAELTEAVEKELKEKQKQIKS